MDSWCFPVGSIWLSAPVHSRTSAPKSNKQHLRIRVRACLTEFEGRECFPGYQENSREIRFLFRQDLTCLSPFRPTERDIDITKEMCIVNHYSHLLNLTPSRDRGWLALLTNVQQPLAPTLWHSSVHQERAGLRSDCWGNATLFTVPFTLLTAPK